MSGYFSNFSLNKITDSIATAAHKTQDTLSSAIANVNLNDPQTKLSLKAHTRYLQESLGTIDEISKLPPQYQSLEKKSDALEKCCKRLLLVTKTFEVEGYDYPPNITETISDWWSVNKDGWFGSSSKSPKEAKSKSKSSANKESSEGLLPRSFAQAISKAANDCSAVFTDLQDTEKKGQEDQFEDEEDEDITNVTNMFNSWSKCYKNIDEGKHEMDDMIMKEFNKKLEKIINEDFKNVHSLRKKVEDSRLKFDTIRYEIKLKESQHEKETEAKGAEAPTDIEADTATAENSKKDVTVDSQKEKTDETVKPSKDDTAETAPLEKHTSIEAVEPFEPIEHTSEDNELLEQLEDEFVSNTSAAVETMGEVTDSSEIIGLAKLFQNFQLVYFRQCVQEVEASLKTLSELEGEIN